MYSLDNSKLLADLETMQSMSSELLMPMESGGFSISTQTRIVGDFHTQAKKPSQETVCGELLLLPLTKIDQVSSNILRA